MSGSFCCNLEAFIVKNKLNTANDLETHIVKNKFNNIDDFLGTLSKNDNNINTILNNQFNFIFLDISIKENSDNLIFF